MCQNCDLNKFRFQTAVDKCHGFQFHDSEADVKLHALAATGQLARSW